MELLAFVLLLIFGVLVCVFRFWSVISNAGRLRREHVRQENIVLARVKGKRDSVWICKFFKFGDHYGFFHNKPQSDRVEAIVVSYDEKRKMFELKELY